MQLAPQVEAQAASELLGWVLGQSAALAVALLWVGAQWLQRREQSRELAMARADLASCQLRNEQLSQALVRSIESASLERSKVSDQRVWLLDSTMRSFVDLLSQVLTSALTLPEKSAELSRPETK